MSQSVIEINAAQFGVESVTVYKDRAAVKRRFPVDFEAGQNEVVISPLSVFLEHDSLRVETETPYPNQHLIVFDVVESQKDIDIHDKSTIDESLVTLRKERDALKAHLAALDDQGKILMSYANSLTGESTKAEELDNFLELYLTREKKRHEAKETTSGRLEDLDQKIAIKEAKLKKKTGDDKTKKVKCVSVIVSADEKGSAEVILSYIVKGASWLSHYDIRATLNPSSPLPSSGAKTQNIVSLQYRASIWQKTGEDWNNVALTLSTASPMLGTGVPQLQPWFIGPPLPLPKPGTSAFGSAFSAAPEMKGRFGPLPQFQQQVQMQQSVDTSRAVTTSAPELIADSSSARTATSLFGATNRPVSANEGAMSSTFDVAGRSNIPSDDSFHKVSIVNLDLAAELDWITVPRVTPVAMLQCKIRNTSHFYFIAGESSVFLDGTFVTRSRIPNVPPQDTFSCSLGIDPSVRVTCHPQRKVVKTLDTTSIFLTSAAQREKNKVQVTNFSHRITIKNTRAASIRRLIVRDQVPLSEDERIKVILVNPSETVMGSPFEPSDADDSVRTKSTTSKIQEKGTTTQVTGIVPRWTQKDGNSGGPKGDGILEWVCTDIPSSAGTVAATPSKGGSKPGVLNIDLEYDITTPQDVKWQSIFKHFASGGFGSNT